MKNLIFVLIFLLSASLFGNKKIYSGGDILKVIPFGDKIYGTGLKNKGLYDITNGIKKDVISKDITIKNFIIDKNSLKLEANDQLYKLENNNLKNLKISKKVKMLNKGISILTKNGWLEITDRKDFYYLPRVYGDYILYSGLRKGLFLYNQKTKITHYIDKGNHANFSDDGKYIIFSKIEDDGKKYISGDLYLYSIDSKKVKTLLVDSKVKTYPILYKNKVYYQSNFNIYSFKFNK